MRRKNVVYPPRRRICLTEPFPFPFLLADWQQMGCLMDATEKICEGDGTEELLEPYGTESLYMCARHNIQLKKLMHRPTRSPPLS